MDVVHRTAEALDRICADPQLEAAWLATVSRLEFLGARKIFKTVASRFPSAEILEHLAHETGHAHVFAALAHERGNPAPLGIEAGIHWFQTVDHAVETAVDAVVLDSQTATHLKYLGTTALIERRAMSVYPLFRARTRDPQVRETLDRVIREEASHRHPIEREAQRRWAAADLSFEHLFPVEEAAFAAWLSALSGKSTPVPDAAYPSVAG